MTSEHVARSLALAFEKQCILMHLDASLMHPVLVLLITLSYLVQGVQGHGQAKHLNHHGDKRIGETAEMQRNVEAFHCCSVFGLPGSLQIHRNR